MVLESKLKQKNIQYEEITDMEKIMSYSVMTVPTLIIDGRVLQFKDAIDWVNEQEVNE
jgi:hypothetical protein